MKAEITSLAVKSGVNFLGRTGLSNFTCTNYISCMHDDLDFSLEDFLKRRKRKKGQGALRPCVQLRKTHCGRDDYNFAYVQWGVVVRTMTNTVWYVLVNCSSVMYLIPVSGFSMAGIYMALSCHHTMYNNELSQSDGTLPRQHRLLYMVNGLNAFDVAIIFVRLYNKWNISLDICNNFTCMILHSGSGGSHSSRWSRP
jgi:hypothetical protein